MPGSRCPSRSRWSPGQDESLSTYRDEAVVLRKLDYGEADRIFTLLTRDHGKLGAIAKGVRRPESRLGPALELYAQVDVLLARGRGHLDVIAQAERVRGPRLEADVVRTGYASLIVEVADRVCDEHHPLDGLFELTAGAMRALAQEADGRRASAYFLGRALGILGFAVQMEVCASCGRPLEPAPSPFSPSAGGFLCTRCALPGMPATSVTALKVLRVIGTGEGDLYARLQIAPPLMGEVETVLEAQLEHHLEGRLKSLAFLRAMRP